MTQLIDAIRVTAARWRASNQEHRGGVVLVWDGVVYGWKNELRDAESERLGVYAVDNAGAHYLLMCPQLQLQRGDFRLCLGQFL